MFIERSVAKIRVVRTLFVLLALLPCAGLASWAAYRHSAAHRAGMQLEVERLLGVPVSIDAVRHLRPGALRCGRCSLRSPDGAAGVTVEDVEVEVSADELRLRIPALACPPGAAGFLGGIARAWLTEPVRFARSWVIDIERLTWADAAGATPGRGPRPLRIECVAAGEARAVRIVRPGHDGHAADEVRVIVQAASHGPGTTELHASVGDPVPWAVVRTLAGSTAVAGLPFGPETIVSGTFTASASASGWTGAGTGRIDGIDLADISGGYRLAGEAAIDVDSVSWRDDRLARLEARCLTGRGRLAQSLLDALVTVGGCRPGPAHRSLGGDSVRPFDEIACSVAIDETGLRVRAIPGRQGSLMRLQGLSLVDEPAAALPFDRVAWLLSPTPGPAVPAAPGSAWLMALMPSAPQAGDTSAGQTGGARAAASGQRKDF